MKLELPDSSSVRLLCRLPGGSVPHPRPPASRLEAGCLGRTRSEERLGAGAGTEWTGGSKLVVNGLPPSQMGTVFNQYVPGKYDYGLVVVGLNENIEPEDEKWMETALRALLKTKTNIAHRGRGAPSSGGQYSFLFSMVVARVLALLSASGKRKEMNERWKGRPRGRSESGQQLWRTRS